MNKIVIIVILIIAVISMNIQTDTTTWVVNRIFKESEFNKQAYNIYLDEEENIWVVFPSSTKDIAKKTVVMQKYDTKKKLLLQFDTKVPYPCYYNIKTNGNNVSTFIIDRYYPKLNFKNNTLYLFDPFNSKISIIDLISRDEKSIILEYNLGWTSFNFDEAIKFAKKYKNNFKDLIITIKYGRLLIDNINNIYLSKSLNCEYDK